MYEHIRLDNNTCFYVGKGCGKRYKIKSRNIHHDRIAKKYGMKAIIIKDNLTNDEAYEYEQKLIKHYVFDLGYGIDIDGYRKYEHNHYLTNSTFGGNGSNGMVHSEEWKKQHSLRMMGNNNPMFGINIWDSYDEESKKQIKEKISQTSSGKNNPMFGIPPKERMDPEIYEQWHDKLVTRCSNQTGDKNPNFNNHTLKNILKNNPELKKQWYPSKFGAKNNNAKRIVVHDDNMNLTFDCIKDACVWMKNKLQLTSKISTLQGGVSSALKTHTKYHNLYFKYSD